MTERPPSRSRPAGFTLPAVLVVAAAMLILAVGLLALTSIERKTARSFSDCASIFDSLVTPSTRRATLTPNNFSICSGVATVSSIVSWRMAVTIVSSSSLRSVRMPATSIGCEK